ncbi:MAG: hypothetical protein Q7T74_02920 [Candidatus Saccharibacteria bacterium]|nr:hypothetical protein [Candidatus Saccharibacteria bacterium]
MKKETKNAFIITTVTAFSVLSLYLSIIQWGHRTNGSVELSACTANNQILVYILFLVQLILIITVIIVSLIFVTLRFIQKQKKIDTSARKDFGQFIKILIIVLIFVSLVNLTRDLWYDCANGSFSGFVLTLLN